MTAPRAAVLLAGLVCAAGCGDSGESIVDNWRGEVWYLDGSFSDQFQSGGGDRWIVTDSPALTVELIPMASNARELPGVEIGSAPAGIWATAVDDVWVAGPGLWRWDGAWNEVDLGGPIILLDVWGSAPDDVWVLTEDDVVLHLDGDTWSEDTPATVEEGAFSLQEGCANAPDDVWMRGVADDAIESGLFHYDGETWNRVDAADGVSDLFCDGHDVWLIGNEPGGAAFVHLRLGGAWEPRCVTDEGSPEFHHVWAPGGDEAYIVGRTQDRVEVWDCFEGRLYALIDGTLPGEPDDTFRGIWSNGAEISIYGADGLRYGYLWDLE